MLIHSDVWGLVPNATIHEYSYFVLFFDGCTRMSWVYFLKRKSEVFNHFVKFYKMIQTQFNKQTHILRSDNKREYMKLDMKEFITSNGLIHQTSCSGTPQQNGVVERKNRTLLEMARALMFESHVPASFWSEAIATSNYLMIRLPTKKLDFKTPLETLKSFTTIPPSHNLPPRLFGCVVYVHLKKGDRNKSQPRVVKSVFVGYGVHQKGYRCFDLVYDKMYTTMDCDFFEDSFYYTLLTSQGESTCGDLSCLTYSEMT